MRLNRLRHSLPDVMEELPDLARLNISGNGLSEVNTDHVKHLQQLNCSDNSLKILSIVEGPLKELAARNNSMCVVSNNNY
jgi:Leucine-rich repeat (LRR) protein